MNGHQPTDHRPQTCRNRLRDEGHAYPKSGCVACGNGGLMGCPHEKRPTPPLGGSGVKPPQSWARPVVTDLVAENARLRQALERITLQYMGCGGNLTPSEICLAMEMIARDALAIPAPSLSAGESGR